MKKLALTSGNVQLKNLMKVQLGDGCEVWATSLIDYSRMQLQLLNTCSTGMAKATH
jgi:hypothetical protein